MDENRSGAASLLKPDPTGSISRDAAHLLLLTALWGISVLIVNPSGEFMVNDDWAFTKALENLIFQGRMGATGWGPSWAPGGPSLIAHLLWARIFTELFGFSLTVLRISVLSIGFLGSLALWMLLRFSGNSRVASSFGALTLIANPIFFSQCFTFMTDVTFVSFAIFSIMFISLGIEKSSRWWVVTGLFFALCSILTRQIGLVIPCALLLVSFLHTSGKRIGEKRILLYVILIALIPWMGYEYYLSSTGSTPLTRHQVVYEMFRRPGEEGFFQYLAYLGSSTFLIGLPYVGFLISPVLFALHGNFSGRTVYRVFFVFATSVLALFELGYLAGGIGTPTPFFRNVIYNFGIGPVLLKDVYILGMVRSWSVGPLFYYVLVYWASLSGMGLFLLIVDSAIAVTRGIKKRTTAGFDFLSAFALASALGYFVVILLTGFHDRYLIPLCTFLLIWLLSEKRFHREGSLKAGRLLPALVPLILMAVFSIGGTHDFMALKRSLKTAQDYLICEKHVDPCSIDGGLEFNGYHCYSPDFKPVEGLSWWWVRRQDYVLTLGPLPGYEAVKTFPFRRFLGPQGEVAVLTKGASTSP